MSKTYMLDTCICSFIMREHPEMVLKRLAQAVLGSVFTRPRLQAIFPLCLYARDRSADTRRRFTDLVHPVVTAVRETLDAGTAKMEIRITGLEPGTPQLFLVLQGQDSLMPFAHEKFSELLRTLAVWHAHPTALDRGLHGQNVRLSTRETAGNEVIFGLGALRVFLPEAGFSALISRCGRIDTDRRFQPGIK